MANKMDNYYWDTNRIISELQANMVLDLSKTANSTPAPIVSDIYPREEYSAFLPTPANIYNRTRTLEEQLALDLTSSFKSDENSDSSCSINSATSTHEFSPHSLDRKHCPMELNKDELYRERRRKNNISAKKSRDMKRERIAQVEERVRLLEIENAQLQESLAACCTELNIYKHYLPLMGFPRQ